MRRDRMAQIALIGLLMLTAPLVQADNELKELLLKQDYAGAWSRAQALEADAVGDPVFDMLYAQAALAVGEADFAVFALERVLLLQPDNHRARLELARAFYQTGNWDAAKHHFQRVLTVDPPPNVRANIQQFLDAIDRQRALLGQRWSAFVQLRTGYDSNVGSATTDSTLSIPAIGELVLSDASLEQSDHFLDKQAGLIWQKPLAKTRALFATVQYKDRENFDTQASDLRSIGVSAGPVFAFAGGRLTLPVNAQALYLANDRYRTLLAVSANWLRPINNRNDLGLFAQLGSIKYPDQSARNVDMKLLGVSWEQHFADPGVKLTLSGYLGDEDTQTRVAEQNGKDYHGLRLSADWAVRDTQSVYASVTGQWSQYDIQDPVFVETRKEDFAQAVLGWTWGFKQPWELSAEVSAIKNNATISLYEYERRQVMLGVKYRFE